MVTVYGKPGCVQCTATVRKLKELGKGVHYEDVTENEAAFLWVKEMGYQSVPVVVPSFDKIITDHAGERIVHWSGFRPDLLEQL